MKVSYAFMHAGQVRYSGRLHTPLTDPRQVAEELIAASATMCDEVHVWVGDTATGLPAAVASRNGATS